MTGIPLWGTLIALLHNGKPVLGIADHPFLGERFWGDGLDAFSRSNSGTGKLSTRHPVALSDAVICVGSAAAFVPHLHQRLSAIAPCVRMIRYGADCYDTCMLAEGHIDAILHQPRHYDIAAVVPSSRVQVRHHRLDGSRRSPPAPFRATLARQACMHYGRRLSRRHTSQIRRAFGGMSDSDDLVQRDAAVFFHQEGSSPCIAGIRHVSGMWIEDLDGNRYIDLHGNTCHHLGHAHPRLVAALKQQLEELAFSPRRYTNTPATELAERLTARFRNGRSKLLLMPGGSERLRPPSALPALRPDARASSHWKAATTDTAWGVCRSRPRTRTPPASSHRRRLPHQALLGPPSRRADGMLQSLAACLDANRDQIGCLVAEPMRSNCHVPPPWLWPPRPNSARPMR